MEITNKHKRLLECNGEYQDMVRKFVQKEVIYCVSYLINELSKNPDSDYYNDLINICSVPDEENEDEYIEAMEHWIVSDWLADKLSERGEMVNKDIYGLTVWGRCTTGQAVYLDSVIKNIFNEFRNSKVAILATALEIKNKGKQ